MKTAVVTGVAGFIGSNLTRELLHHGYECRGIDNFSTGREENLNGIINHDSFEFYEEDLRDAAAIAPVVEGADVVFHQAAIPSVPRSIDDPQLTTEANCVGTANLLVAARDEGVDRAVVASSSSVYGSGIQVPNHEDESVSPESPYALSKYYTEELAIEFSEFYDIDTVALRYFNVFGPRQDPQGEYAAVIPTFIHRMLEGTRPVIYGDGQQTRDFTFIDNVVEANLLAARGEVSGKVYNVACGNRITLNNLVAELKRIIETDLDPVYDDPRPGDVRHSQAAIERISEDLGYEPVIGFSEGLQETVDWFK